jgi:transposase InsO family protein
LIRWKLVTHAFIDGKSRFITGIRVSDNNRSDTVLDLFLEATAQHGFPSRVRGDHGVENVKVAQRMEDVRGAGRGSYIWGR